MAKLSIVNIDKDEVVYSGNTRKKKWSAVVQEGVEIIKGLDVNTGYRVLPQGTYSVRESNIPVYSKGSGMWLLSKGGKYQLVLEQ